MSGCDKLKEIFEKSCKQHFNCMESYGEVQPGSDQIFDKILSCHSDLKKMLNAKRTFELFCDKNQNQ